MTKLQPAKRNGKRTKNVEIQGKSEEDLRKQLHKLGPMRLRKYAISGLNIPAEVADGWNDFDFMLDYCVKKALGQELPEAPQEPDVDEEELDDSNEFNADDLDEDEPEKSSDEDDDDEMEDGAGTMFADPEEDDEMESDETEPEPEPEPAPKRKRGRPKKTERAKTAPDTKDASGDVDAAITQLLDVITNQGVALQSIQKSNARLEAMCKEMYVRQAANHGALSNLAKAVFSISAMVSEFIPRALKAMRFKPSVMKEIRSRADAAGSEAESVFNSLLDPEADSEED